MLVPFHSDGKNLIPNKNAIWLWSTHMDYIRFCGNASKYNFPETGLSAVGIVTECCRQMHEAVKAINPDAILSAVLMPMIYRWVKELTSWFISNAGEADVWFGIQTYSVNTDNKKTTDLKADEILAEYKRMKSAGADGVVLFRHGLGFLPDLRDF